MPAYAWIYPNKQDSEYASGPKCSKILKTAGFLIFECYTTFSISQNMC